MQCHNMQIIHEKRRISYAVSKMFEEDYCFSCSRNDRFPLANYKNSCVTLWSIEFEDSLLLKREQFQKNQ